MRHAWETHLQSAFPQSLQRVICHALLDDSPHHGPWTITLACLTYVATVDHGIIRASAGSRALVEACVLLVQGTV